VSEICRKRERESEMQGAPPISTNIYKYVGCQKYGGCPCILAGMKGRVFEFLSIGWLRLVGSLTLQVSFAEYSLFYSALLQKRPMILRSLLIVATPYEYLQVCRASCVSVSVCERERVRERKRDVGCLRVW